MMTNTVTINPINHPKLAPKLKAAAKREKNVLIKLICHLLYTIKPVLHDLPREQRNMVTYDRWSLNIGLIDIKCTGKGNKNKVTYYKLLLNRGGHYIRFDCISISKQI